MSCLVYRISNPYSLIMNFQLFTEALGPLSREKDKLLNDYNEIKAELGRQCEEQAEQIRNYKQEVDELLKTNSKIKE